MVDVYLQSRLSADGGGETHVIEDSRREGRLTASLGLGLEYRNAKGV